MGWIEYIGLGSVLLLFLMGSPLAIVFSVKITRNVIYKEDGKRKIESITI